MNSFLLSIIDIEQQLQQDDITSFVASDDSGSFGILANHAPMVTCLRPGIARYRRQQGAWLYIAQAGAVLTFRSNHLHIATPQFLHSEDHSQLVAQMDAAWHAAAQELQQDRQHVVALEQSLARKLWQLSRGKQE